jgi:hypothetical protein
VSRPSRWQGVDDVLRMLRDVGDDIDIDPDDIDADDEPGEPDPDGCPDCPDGECPYSRRQLLRRPGR